MAPFPHAPELRLKTPRGATFTHPMILFRPALAAWRRWPFCTELIRVDGLAATFPRPVTDGIFLFRGRTMDRILPEPPAAPTAHRATHSPGRGPARGRIVSKLWRTAERQVREVESRLAQLRDDPAALERDAKTLAIIARTVRDLVAIDDNARAGDEPKESETSGLQRMPIADFRRELAEKLEHLRRDGAGSDAP